VRFIRTVAIACGVVGLAAFGAPSSGASAPTIGTGTAQGLGRLVAANPTGIGVGIATMSATPNGAALLRLRTLGLQVQGMKHLPLAIVKGPIAAMKQAVATGAANDVYPDDRIQLLDTASSDAMGSAGARAAGFTGKGVTVAVVDSGCDATHPDLADHVVHNVSLFGPEYANMPPDPNQAGDGALVVPIEQSPYDNSDIGGGHGTHVSGIVAADGTTSPDHLGVAPDASLVCYSIGEVLFTTMVVSAYDHMMDHPEWGIDVVNNSWGNPFLTYDPQNPVNVATKAVADRGVVVVFAAGNSGAGDAEISLNPFSEAPWVISVAAGNLDHKRSDFSSNGIEFDNSLPVAPSGDGVAHATFTGSRVGVYHPDVTAPGENISSTCDVLGTVVGPCPPGQNASASGTSMASPHVAGAAAVLLQANPRLTVDQVRMALQVTATPVTRTDTDDPAPFWEVGYGYVDLTAAVHVVQAKNYAALLKNRQATIDRALLKSLPRVAQSDLWTWDTVPVTVAGVPDTKQLQVTVPSSVKGFKVAVAYPSAATVGLNGMQYDATVKDAAGKAIGTTTANFFNGTSTVFIDLTKVDGGVTYGTFTIDVTGLIAVSDPDTVDSDSDLGRMITVAAAQTT
jgi:serine protease AprX